MSRPAHLWQAGISLIELLLGLAITALVMAPLTPMLQTAFAATRIAGNQVALEREADFALERIAARIRATVPTKALIDKPSDEWLKPAVYSLSNGTLIERQGTQTYILAESVSAFSLSASAVNSDQPLVTVSLTLDQNNASTTAQASVRMGIEQ
jgi:Tfp pilus assembly protein FimT